MLKVMAAIAYTFSYFSLGGKLKNQNKNGLKSSMASLIVHLLE